jgi:hypothetical protein
MVVRLNATFLSTAAPDIRGVSGRAAPIVRRLEYQ